MAKDITNLTFSELVETATESWKLAAQKALEAGIPVTGSRDGRRIKYFPDGHIEDLGPVAGIPSDDKNQKKKLGRSAS
jgi:hypothetical protein